MFDNLRADTRRLRETKTKPFPWYVVESLAFDTGYQAVVLHRLAHWFKRRRIPVLGPAIARWNQFVTGVDIAPAAEIGPGLRISHGTGLVVGNAVRIGRDCLLLQNVTLGAPHTFRLDEMPTIGDRVILGAGSAVVGRVSVGDDSFVGAHALVSEDVPPGSKVLAKGGVEVRPRSSSSI
jgi:serine O-acetyltransferase